MSDPSHKPQLKMEESTTAEESDMTEKQLTKKRLPTKVNIIIINVHLRNKYYCDGISITET